MDQRIERRYILIILALFLGMMFRYWAMSFGHNSDFDSYCIVGDLVRHLQNVYANTDRYNYGPVFFCIQGLLYRISFFISENPIWTYRILMVSLLSLVDLGIAGFIADRKDIKHAVLFFLNPVSIIITGYHNQFDNIAVLLALCSLYFYNEEDEFGKKDWLFLLCMSLCLMTKHILFAIPFFLLFKRGLPLKKKMIYTVVPPVVFLSSFLPFAISNRQALEGILNNVFLYRSSENAPLLNWLYELIHFPQNLQLFVFGILMCITGFLVRGKSFEYGIMIYLIALVAFSSSIANQYLVIPVVALCMLETDLWSYIYVTAMTVFLFFNDHGGFNMITVMQQLYPDSLGKILSFYNTNGYVIAAWILFAALVYEAVSTRREIYRG